MSEVKSASFGEKRAPKMTKTKGSQNSALLLREIIYEHFGRPVQLALEAVNRKTMRESFVGKDEHLFLHYCFHYIYYVTTSIYCNGTGRSFIC